jgi:hypothetical protein
VKPPSFEYHQAGQGLIPLLSLRLAHPARILELVGVIPPRKDHA